MIFGTGFKFGKADDRQTSINGKNVKRKSKLTNKLEHINKMCAKTAFFFWNLDSFPATFISLYTFS
ncbi:hypothetical protein LBK6_01230 [Leptospira borgpetersenii serovar Hardjo]|nr:hypothetical protein LBK6_01230 [Leptospira borgpetersenii serovar Hardjo]AMX60296.1 hypothetical protein LBK9_01230 [Leptospira borgpetersenii serovar Hardjo]AMX63543.1 hypothetical protein LBK30_01245 [Leptospira borgpetersenii serovar Hardjo]AMX66782.1 hypothetical protein LBHA_01245 [Leptospira borgpetersenii serovar Hardjo]AWV68987.1 hypothetical protein B9T54_01355 [Leptospira borgpetersenii serovar Hardjo-bovis]